MPREEFAEKTKTALQVLEITGSDKPCYTMSEIVQLLHNIIQNEFSFTYRRTYPYCGTKGERRELGGQGAKRTNRTNRTNKNVVQKGDTGQP